MRAYPERGSPLEALIDVMRNVSDEAVRCDDEAAELEKQAATLRAQAVAARADQLQYAAAHAALKASPDYHEPAPISITVDQDATGTEFFEPPLQHSMVDP